MFIGLFDIFVRYLAFLSVCLTFLSVIWHFCRFFDILSVIWHFCRFFWYFVGYLTFVVGFWQFLSVIWHFVGFETFFDVFLILCRLFDICCRFFDSFCRLYELFLLYFLSFLSKFLPNITNRYFSLNFALFDEFKSKMFFGSLFCCFSNFCEIAFSKGFSNIVLFFQFAPAYLRMIHTTCRHVQRFSMTATNIEIFYHDQIDLWLNLTIFIFSTFFFASLNMFFTLKSVQK